MQSVFLELNNYMDRFPHHEFLINMLEETSTNMKIVISPVQERADCTVRATAAAMEIPYHEAHAKLAALGRKPRGGWHFKGKNAERLGLELRGDLSGRTLAKILPDLAHGRFVVRHARHVFAVIDGTVVDWKEPNPGLRVKMVYQLTSP